MNIEQIREQAVKLQQECDIPSEDWRTEIQKIWKANKQVKEWQFLMKRAFGSPQIKRQRNWDWENMEVGQIFQWSPDDWETWEFKFNHACVIQIQNVEEKGDHKIVHYRAELRVDDQAFLNDMLPVSVERKDPTYKLIEINIQIPKEQVVSESLRKMNEKISNSFTKKSRIIRHLKQNCWIFFSVPIGAFIGYIFLGMFGGVEPYGGGTCQGWTSWICGDLFGIKYSIIGSIVINLIVYQISREKGPR